MFFKTNGYGAIFDAEHKVVSDHYNCRLGKWYAGIGKENFQNTAASTNLIKSFMNRLIKRLHVSKKGHALMILR